MQKQKKEKPNRRTQKSQLTREGERDGHIERERERERERAKERERARLLGHGPGPGSKNP